MFLRMLTEAEKRASASAESAAAMLADRSAVAAVLDGLKRPSSGSAYTAWAASAELAQAARVAAQLLRHGDCVPEASHALQRACIAAAQVQALVQIAVRTVTAIMFAQWCPVVQYWHEQVVGHCRDLQLAHALHVVQAALHVAPDTTASIAGDLSQAEASMPGGSFIGFQGTQQLYIAMLDRRQQQSSPRVACAGACGLSGLFSRAKVCSRSKGLRKDANCEPQAYVSQMLSDGVPPSRKHITSSTTVLHFSWS